MDVNCPGSQEDLVSNWEPTRSLVEDAISGAEIAPALGLWLSPTCLSASGGRWADSQTASSPLVFSQSFVLSRPNSALGYSFLWESSLSLFLSLWLSHSLGCYLTLVPSDGPQGIQAQSLP